MARYRCCTCYSRTWSAGSLAVIRSRRKEIAGGLVNPVQPFHPNVPPPNDVVLLIRRHGFNNAMIWFVKLITDPFTDIVAYYGSVLPKRAWPVSGAGDKVILWIVSGNRDERVFSEADRLVLDRNGPRPLSFGSGVHHCIGLRLAQLQVRALWEELIRRYRSIEMVGPLQRTSSNFVFGTQSMPVIVRY